MECPVCGKNHIHDARDLLSRRQEFFTPCPDCRRIIRDKAVPPDDFPSPSCRCRKVFIDDIYARLYHLLVDAGLFTGEEPLSSVGTPLIDPGLFLRFPPHLPPRTLMVISSFFDKEVAERAYQTIPQISCILSDRGVPPGIGDIRDFSMSVSSENTLLCGCDVRSDLFPTSKGPIVVYKKQGSTHIEFPHGFDPKIRSVESAVRKVRPEFFVDACCGSGTLGLAGMRLGVQHTLLNDPWYAAAFFAGFNLFVNKEVIGLDECRLHTDFNQIRQDPVREDSFPVAHGYGPEQDIEVFQGAMNFLPSKIAGKNVLTVFDPFDKKKFMRNQQFLSFWERTVGGEVIIP